MTFSSKVANAVEHFMSAVPDEPMVPHKNHQIQSKILTIGELPHMKTALSFRQGQSYGDLSLLCKIRILEFLLDELVATVPITSELQNRHKVTSCYPGTTLRWTISSQPTTTTTTVTEGA